MAGFAGGVASWMYSSTYVRGIVGTSLMTGKTAVRMRSSAVVGREASARRDARERAEGRVERSIERVGTPGYREPVPAMA